MNKKKITLINFKCSKCGEGMEAPVELTGEAIECPKCGLHEKVPLSKEYLLITTKSKYNTLWNIVKKRRVEIIAVASVVVCLSFLTFIDNTTTPKIIRSEPQADAQKKVEHFRQKRLKAQAREQAKKAELEEEQERESDERQSKPDYGSKSLALFWARDFVRDALIFPDSAKFNGYWNTVEIQRSG